MAAIDVEADPSFGLRAATGAAPVAEPAPTDGGEAVFGAAFRQTNSVVSAIQYMRNSGRFAPERDYNPLNDIKGWKEPNYFLEHGTAFVGSQSPAETQSIKGRIDQETADKKALAANGTIGFVASTMAGVLDPTLLLPGGVAVDAAKGGLSFTKAAVRLGVAGGVQTAAQEGILQSTQETRELSESALNVASGTLLTALIGGGAASLLSRGERAAIEGQLHADRAAINEHAGNPASPEERIRAATVEVKGKVYEGANHVAAIDAAEKAIGMRIDDISDEGVKAGFITTSGRIVDREAALDIAQAQGQHAPEQVVRLPTDAPPTERGLIAEEANFGRGLAASVGAAASDTRQIELVNFGLNQIPGVKKLVETTSPMQRMFGAESVTVRRAAADLAETSLLTKENLEGKVTTAGPALDREARLIISQTQVAVGDEMSRLFSEYRFGDQVRAPRLRAGFEDITGRADVDKLTFDTFKEEVSTAMRNGDTHEVQQVQAAAQFIRNKVFEPMKKRAIAAGLLPEDVDVKTANSYLQRVYNKQAIAAKRPAFVNAVTDWLEADQAGKAQAKERITAYHGALESHSGQIDKLEQKIASLSEDSEVIQARAEEVTRVNKLAFQRAEKMRNAEGDIDNARGGAVFETQARNRGNALADRASGKLAEIDALEQKLATEIQNHDLMRAKIEKEIAAWEGKSVTEAKSALKAREKAEAARAAKPGNDAGGGKRMTSADSAIDSAVRKIMESNRDLERQELRGRADEITDRVLGSPDGRLPYDIGSGGPKQGAPSGEQPRGPLAAREFNIPDKILADGGFLENDIEHIVNTHLRTMVPDVLLTEKFGDTAMTETFRKINDEYAALSDAAKSEADRTRIEKQRQRAIDDLAAVRDRIRGTYGLAADGPMRNAARAAAVLKNYNVLTSMGSAALSSLPDMAGVVMRHGMTNVFSDAWAPFFSFMTKQSDAWGEGARQYRAMGIATEMVSASRHNAMNDILDSYHPQSRVERTMQWATNKFQFANMLAPWTDWAKVNASLVSGSEVLRATRALAEGKATARQLRNLGESGIEPHMAERIHRAFEAGGEVRDGVHLPNTADWADGEARRVFEGAVARDADISVITPGQEKPLWMSHSLFSVFGQFKSFTAAANERVLIANLQRRDAQVLHGFIFSLGMGMLSYKLNSLTGGSPVSDRPQDWIKEGLSKSGAMGWLEEGNALTSKMTQGGVDMYRIIGADKPLTRFASRSAMDQVLGPTVGKLGNIIGAAGAISTPKDWNEADTKAIRRLVAGQNVFWLRNVLDQVEKSGNNAFGIEMKAKPENR